MRDEQDFYIGQCGGAAAVDDVEAVVVDLPVLPGKDTRLREALAVVEAHERAPIIVALDRWAQRREGLDDRWCPTLRQLRAELLNLQAQIKRPGPANPSRTEWTVGRVQRFVTVRDYGALCVLFGALTGGMHPQDEADDDDGLDDDGLDDDGLDDDDDDDLDDDDTDDDGLDDDEHGADCFCGACCEAQLVGLATVAGDDPDAYLARSGAGDLATVGREVLDDEGLDEDSLDFNPCPRPPDCDWCGGKGCDTCSDPNYAGVDP